MINQATYLQDAQDLTASISRFSRSEIDTIGELLSVAVISIDPTFGRQGSPSDWSRPELNPRLLGQRDAVRLGADNGCHRSGTACSHGVGPAGLPAPRAVRGRLARSSPRHRAISCVRS